MNSLYIHIPFCLKKCSYCDFVSNSGWGDGTIEAYVAAAVREISLLPPSSFATIFFGGGTPTALPWQKLEQIVSAIREHHSLEENYEMTVEANPETITSDYSKALHNMGVNRVSMGLQSTDNAILSAIGRVHTYERFLSAYEDLRNGEIDNINIDVMYALPKQTPEIFHHTLAQVQSLSPEHISAYELNLSGNSPMDRAISKGELVLPTEDEIIAMTDCLQMLETTHARYEISNYAKRGRECRHNLNYWHNGGYYGVGCGAHGCIITGSTVVRTENSRDLQEYIFGTPPLETVVSVEESMFETVMTGLRLIEGISERAFAGRYKEDIYQHIGEYIEASPQLIQRQDGYIRLTSRGLDIQNTVLTDLIPCFYKP